MSAPGGKRLVNSKSGLKILCQHDKDASPWELSEPQWQSDNEVTNCTGCGSKFSLLNRRHHCRRCGKIFCNGCCNGKLLLHRMAFVDPVRHCKSCHAITKIEEEFFTKHIKVLFEGAPFHVALAQTSAENLQVPKLYSCKLTTDQRFLLFDEHELDVGPESALEPLEIAKILDLEPILDDKNQSAVSICLRAKMNGNDELSLRLDSPPEPSRKPSVVWLSALRKGLDMVIGTKDEPSD